MSTDTGFVPRTVPLLQGERQQEVEDSARARGYAAGYAAGARAAQEEARRARAALEEQAARRAAEHAERTEHAVAVLREAARALDARVAPVVAEAQDAVLRGALELTEAVLGVQLADREVAARAALVRATSGGTVVAVRLHPDDARLLAGVDAVHLADVRLVDDPTLRPGDAVAELEHGFLDARVRSAVERARAALAELGGERAAPGGTP